MRSAGLQLIASLVVAGLAMGTRPVVAQSPPQVPIFKGRLDVVRVDVSVIENKSGRPVSGLTERDFALSENGIRQSISSFVDESLGAASSSRDDPANRRVFLFILSPLQNPMQGTYKQHDGVAQFIRERLRSEDLVGVMSLTRVSPLTVDHQRIAAIVDRLKEPGVWPDFIKVQRATRTAQAGWSVEAERFADNSMEPGSAETGFFKSTIPLLLGSKQERQNVDAQRLLWSTRALDFDALKVVAGIEYLRAIPGDKHIVILTNGFDRPIKKIVGEGVGLLLRSAEDDQRLARDANNAGVALDIIQVNDYNFSVMSGETVAGNSGGQFSSLRIAAQQLTRIDDGTRNGYIIGYLPSNPELDGKYRDIKVAVNRKDVTVVYRHGYTAAADPPPIDAREVFTRQRLRDAAAGIADVNDIVLKVQAAKVTGSAPQVRVDLNINLTGVPLSEKSGKWEADFNLLILCGDKKREVTCRLDQRMTLSLTQAQYDQAKLSGVPYSTNLPVTGVATLVKVIAYHFDSDRIGVFTLNLK